MVLMEVEVSVVETAAAAEAVEMAAVEEEDSVVAAAAAALVDGVLLTISRLPYCSRRRM